MEIRNSDDLSREPVGNREADSEALLGIYASLERIEALIKDLLAIQIRMIEEPSWARAAPENWGETQIPEPVVAPPPTQEELDAAGDAARREVVWDDDEEDEKEEALDPVQEAEEEGGAPYEGPPEEPLTAEDLAERVPTSGAGELRSAK